MATFEDVLNAVPDGAVIPKSLKISLLDIARHEAEKRAEAESLVRRLRDALRDSEEAHAMVSEPNVEALLAEADAYLSARKEANDG